MNFYSILSDNIAMEVNFNKPSKNNIFITSLSNRAEGNFFASGPSFAEQPKKQTNSNSARINDYDSSILENNAYQGLSDEMLKIEHKIGLLESSLSKINIEIDALKEYEDFTQVNQLEIRKQAIEQELAELNKKYSDLGIGAKISGQIASVVNFTSNKKSSSMSKVKDFLSKKVLAKVSKKFGYSQDMKSALEKLSSINSNVDELITMQAPYGETVNRYEKLTAYLNKANVIHSQISKEMKEMT